jgi:Uma2 family endonuclease
MTIAEFVHYEDPNGYRSELVRGTIALHRLSTAIRGFTAANIGFLLGQHVGHGSESKGWLTARTGVILHRNPDTLVGPDLVFWNIAQEQVLHEGYFESLPDLVVEIVSTDEEREGVSTKLADYVSSGVKLVWLVDPEVRTVTVYAGSMRGTELDENETITGGDVLPNFSCKVADFFG